MDSERYFNELIYRLEELLFHELSDCAPWKTELVGIDFIQAEDIRGNSEDEIVLSCINQMKAAGLIEDMTYSISSKGIQLQLWIKGCRHLLKETLLRQSGIKPYNCPITNMILDQLIEKLHFTTTYVAELTVDEAEGRCHVRAAIYASPDKIGSVCDWRHEGN